MAFFSRSTFDKVCADHPTLHHYTSIEGALGILESGTLWATDFRNLNDSSELTHLRERLEDEIAPFIDRTLRALRKRRVELDLAIARKGGPRTFARELAKELVYSHYEIMHAGNSPIDIGRWDVFVSSFCSPAGIDNFSKDNGILSQWRAYAGNGGACFLFDAKKLMDIIEAEQEVYEFGAGLYEVHYDFGQSIRSEYPALIAVFEQLIELWLSGIVDLEKNGRLMSEYIDRIVHASCTFKHGAFHEEREVRIMAIVHQASGHGMRSRSRQPKQLQSKSERRYIVINERALPFQGAIKKIIVGPGSAQASSASRLRKAVGEQIEIALSTIPLVT